MFAFSMVVVCCVLFLVFMEISREKYLEKIRKDMEYDEFITPKRQNVIKGVFRQHNQNFRDNGLNGPKGTA